MLYFQVLCSDEGSVIDYVIIKNTNQHLLTPQNTIGPPEKLIEILDDTILNKPATLTGAKMSFHRPAIYSIPEKPVFTHKNNQHEAMEKIGVFSKFTPTSDEIDKYLGAYKKPFFVALVVFAILIVVGYCFAAVKVFR